MPPRRAPRGNRRGQTFTPIDFAGLPGLPVGKTCKVLFANKREVEPRDVWQAALGLSAFALARSLANFTHAACVHAFGICELLSYTAIPERCCLIFMQQHAYPFIPRYFISLQVHTLQSIASAIYPCIIFILVQLRPRSRGAGFAW